MYSQCPECLTRFRVTAAALRAAHGTVRCGRCGSAFDALPRLTDVIQDAGSSAGPSDPSALALPGDGGMTVATAAGLLAASVGSSVAEFQFSADDIENVFMDARDWQSRFGSSASPGDRAGKLGDTSSAELDQMLDGDLNLSLGDAESSEPSSDGGESRVWVHEPESIEDITLEGERIQIEGFAGFEEDFLEREIEKELEEQTRSASTGSQRTLGPYAELTDAEGNVAYTGDDAVVIDGLEPLHDIDSTNEFEILRDVPESAYPEDEAAQPESAAAPPQDAAELPVRIPTPVPAMPAAVAAAAAGLAAAHSASAQDEPAAPSVTAFTMDPAEQPEVAAPAPARWRRFPEPAADEQVDHAHDPQLVDDLAAAASERRSAWAWGLGALVLTLVLSAQLVHHYRLQLARDANVGPIVRDAYARLGVPLPPAWNLAAFEVRQWGANGAAPSAAGTMAVRASIRNGAAFAQPLPLLRLELEDRFGGTVALRDFEPADYLKNSAQAGRMLAAGSATEAELLVASAATEAVGYRLDVCLRDAAGKVRCAQDGDTAAHPGQNAP